MVSRSEGKEKGEADGEQKRKERKSEDEKIRKEEKVNGEMGFRKLETKAEEVLKKGKERVVVGFL